MMQIFNRIIFLVIWFIFNQISNPMALAQSISSYGKTYQIKDHGGTVPGAIWRFSATDNPKVIPVCWENAGHGSEVHKDLVRNAIKLTWEKYSKLRFLGWSDCIADSIGIRILISEFGPHTKGLGRELDGLRNGLVLNFSFKYWKPACQEGSIEDWIQELAVHEFGHAIGFAHEHNRDDTPAWCVESPQGTNPSIYLTEWDPVSKMNYCHCGDAPLKLSDGDITSVQLLYGAP